MSFVTKRVRAELKGAGCVLRNKHFIYTSGRHSASYINTDPIYTNPRVVARLVADLMQPFAASGFETIAAPAVGGTSLVAIAAYRATGLFNFKSVGEVWMEKQPTGRFKLDRAGFAEQLYCRKVLVIDDVTSNGTSVAGVAEVVRAWGGEVVGASVICRTGPVTAETLKVPDFKKLTDFRFKSFGPDECPLCRDRVPVVEDIGHGKTFKKQHPDYPVEWLLPQSLEDLRRPRAH